MPKLALPLTENQIAVFAPKAKRYKRSDGKKLYLVVEPNGIKRWHFSFNRLGKSTTLSFGNYPDVSLSEARLQRESTIQLIKAGVDPVIERKEQKILERAGMAQSRLLHMSMNVSGGMIIENKCSRILLSEAQVTALKAFLIATYEQPQGN